MLMKIRHIKVLIDKSITKYVRYLHFGFFPQAMASDYVLLAINFFTSACASSFKSLQKQRDFVENLKYLKTSGRR